MGKTSSFKCKICDFNTTTQNKLDRHLNTQKHKLNLKKYNKNNINKKQSPYSCNCGKQYVYKGPYDKHIIKCSKYNSNKNDISNNENIIMEQNTNTSENTKIINKQEHNTNTKTTYQDHKIINIQLFVCDDVADSSIIKKYVEQIEILMIELARRYPQYNINLIPVNLKRNIEDEFAGIVEPCIFNEEKYKPIRKCVIELTKEFDRTQPTWRSVDTIRANYINILQSTVRDLKRIIDSKENGKNDNEMLSSSDDSSDDEHESGN